MRVPIFPVSYYKDSIENNQELKNLIVPKIMNTIDDLQDPYLWFTNKIKTSFLGEKEGKEVLSGENNAITDLLCQKYEKCFNKFFENIPYTIDIDKLWYNCYVDGEFQEMHCHVGQPSNRPHFSCVHFLSFDKTRHKPVVFEDPIYQLRVLSVEMIGNQYSSEHYPDIEEGDFIMFPSYLRHCVYPSPSTPDYPRITISMNFKVLEYGGEVFSQ